MGQSDTDRPGAGNRGDGAAPVAVRARGCREEGCAGPPPRGGSQRGISPAESAAGWAAEMPAGWAAPSGWSR